MTKKQQEEVKIIKREYSSKDFFDLERELEKYAIDKEQKIKGVMTMVHYVPVKGIQQWYIDNGALSNIDQWTVCNIFLFKELQEKMDQFNNWCRRREFAIKQELDGYEELSKSIKIN